MTTVAFQNAEQRYANLEQCLNSLGYWPLLSTLSGLTRGFLGSIQSFLANIAFWFKGAQYTLTRNPETRNEAAAYFWYTTHGSLNGVRGSVEAIPVAGNLATLVYDKVIGLRANYTYESIPSGIDPLFENKPK